jgi:hypothetical protein
MGMTRRSGISGAIVLGLLVGCSSATAPNPSIVGTWHVTLSTLNFGTIMPTSFDVKVTQSGSGYLVTMPTLIWSGGLTFDSGPSLQVPSDSTKTGFTAFTHAPHASHCEWVSIYGVKNAGQDTLSGGTIVIENNDTIPGGCPLPVFGGPATVHK